MESRLSVRRKVQRFADCVDVPAKDPLPRIPVGVALLHLLNRCGFLTVWWIGRIDRAEDIVDGVQVCA